MTGKNVNWCKFSRGQFCYNYKLKKNKTKIAIVFDSEIPPVEVYLSCRKIQLQCNSLKIQNLRNG